MTKSFIMSHLKTISTRQLLYVYSRVKAELDKRGLEQ